MGWQLYISALNSHYRAAVDARLAAGSQSREVLHYRQALWHGYEAIKEKPLSTDLFVEIAEITKGENYV